jgi:hypothetical protein
MSYELAESERVGIIALCNVLTAEGCRPDTVEHIREILTARQCAINSMAARLRQREVDAEVYQGMLERETAEHRQTAAQLATATAVGARATEVQEMEQQLIACAERYYDASSGSIVPFSQRIHALALIERGVRNLREARADAARAGAHPSTETQS